MCFITFEGIDQCGKSTQLKKIEKAAKSAGIDIQVVRDPGGTPLGEQIRKMLLGTEHTNMDPWAEALLYTAARVQLVNEVIKPALAEGKVVISDRYIDSSIVYQGVARGIGVKQILDIDKDATGGLMPDLTFVFNLGVEQSRKRLKKSGLTADRIESEEGSFYTVVANGYLNLEKQFPDRVVVIDASRSIDEVYTEIVSTCKERLNLKLPIC
ncbi:MAG: dTMP kinase [bacterium]|nr:dTMP kinase [bacterium]